MLEINSQNLGVAFGNSRISILLYADDIVLFSENEMNLQKMLTIIDKWGLKWQMKVNPDKTKVIHFRKQKRRQTINSKLGKKKLVKFKVANESKPR